MIIKIVVEINKCSQSYNGIRLVSTDPSGKAVSDFIKENENYRRYYEVETIELQEGE